MYTLGVDISAPSFELDSVVSGVVVTAVHI